MSTKNPPQPLSTKPYNHIGLRPVVSNQVAAVGYHADSKTLALTFKFTSGIVYHYPNVEAATHEAMLAAKSIGQYFGEHIKPLPFDKFQMPAPSMDSAAGLAIMLDETKYPVRLSDEAQATIKTHGLVVIFGASDDLMEAVGAFRDEAGCYEGGKFLLDAEGFLPSWEDVREEEDEEAAKAYLARKDAAKEITVHKGKDGYHFTYSLDVPHSTFYVEDDGTGYCLGLVFKLADLQA